MLNFVLLSGGIDSTTLLANLSYEDTRAISIDYGQRHKCELDSAQEIARILNIPWKVLSITTIPKTMLTTPQMEIPNISYDQIKGVSPTYVPFRNGLMLSTVASYVQGTTSEDATIYFGAHAEDAAGWAYPDCTPEFMGAMANAIYVGTYHKVRLCVPFQHMTKDMIIRYGYEYGIPYNLTWSCYAGGNYHCGVCPTCRARRTAFIKANVKDPTYYVE